MSVYIVKAKKTQLKVPLTPTATEVVLRELKDIDGNNITMANFGDWGVIVVKQGDTVEIIKFDGLTTASDDTVTLDVATSGRSIAPTTPYAGSSTGEDFQSTAEVIVTNDPLTVSQFGNINNAQTWALQQTFTVPPVSSSDATANSELVRYSQLLSAVLGTLSAAPCVWPGTAGETLAEDEAVYLKISDGRWWKADADSASTSENVIRGITRGAAANAGDSIINGITIFGEHEMTGLTANTKYYFSDTAGAISTTPGTKEVTFGYATSTTKIYVFPGYDQQITEDIQDALEGQFGTPNQYNKFLTAIDVEDNGIDQEQTSEDGVIAFGEADATTKYNKLAQSFVAGRKSIKGVIVKKEASTGTHTGDVTVALQADSSGSPSGSNLASVTIPNATWEALTNDAEYEATFSAEYTSADPGTTYWLVFSSSTSDNSNHPNIAYYGASDNYSSGQLKANNTTDGWIESGGLDADDLYFKVVTNRASRIVRRDSTGNVYVATTPTDGDHATSKTYVDTEITTITPGFATGQTSRAAGSGSGTQNIAHGLGTTPSLVIIMATARATTNTQTGNSYGTATGTSDETCTSWAPNGVSQSGTTILNVASGTGSEGWNATLSTLDDTNIELNFTISGAAGTVYIQWIAYK